MSDLRIKPFRELRAVIVRRGWNQKIFAYAMHVSDKKMSEWMNGIAKWELRDVYEACDVLGIPYKDIPIYWPKEDIFA